jgi:hypothetical protein
MLYEKPLSNGLSRETSSSAKLQQRHKELRPETAATPGKQENAQQDKCQWGLSQAIGTIQTMRSLN